jgi:hypothetical protein
MGKFFYAVRVALLVVFGLTLLTLVAGCATSVAFETPACRTTVKGYMLAGQLPGAVETCAEVGR